jgi:pilus assembly protein CpaB
MKLSKGPLFLVVAGLMGLLASYIVHHYISSKTKVVEKPTRMVVVASADISPGTMLNKAMLKTASFPQELVPAKALTNLNEAEGRVIIGAIAAGEPILLTKLAPVGTAAGLGALLASGKRALSVRVDDVSGVAGFVHPGDHVDVLVEIALADSHEHFSKVILQNVVVLTAGQTWEQVRDQKPTPVNTVTLVLSAEETEIINLASNQGRIRLALRNSNDPAPVQTRGVGTSSLFGRREAPQKVAPTAVPKKHENGRNVEVIKGLNRSQSNF